jgi:hypothetical protein
VDIAVGYISHIPTAIGFLKCYHRIAVLRRIHDGDDATDLPWPLHGRHDSSLAVIEALHSTSHSARHMRPIYSRLSAGPFQRPCAGKWILLQRLIRRFSVQLSLHMSPRTFRQQNLFLRLLWRGSDAPVERHIAPTIEKAAGLVLTICPMSSCDWCAERWDRRTTEDGPTRPAHCASFRKRQIHACNESVNFVAIVDHVRRQFLLVPKRRRRLVMLVILQWLRPTSHI